MSKSLGNVIDPWEILDSRGRTPLRWWMFSQGSPWTPTRVSLGAIDTSMRDTLLTLWNTFSFFTTYAVAQRLRPGRPGGARAGRAPRRSTAGSSPGWRATALEVDRGARRLRAPGRRDRPRPPGRRPLQLVRAPEPPAVLADRPRRPAIGLPRRPRDVARGPGRRLPPARPALPVRRRPPVAGADRGPDPAPRSTWPTGRRAGLDGGPAPRTPTVGPDRPRARGRRWPRPGAWRRSAAPPGARPA